MADILIKDFIARDLERAKEYDYYYDQCEKANKVPMSYDAWLKEQKGGIDNETDIA